MDSAHRTLEQLVAAAAPIRTAPADRGTLELIVSRPVVDDRRTLPHAQLDLQDGLVGDNWRTRGSRGGAPSDPLRQLTIMSSRAAAAIAGPRDRWPLAGDQLYVDFDLSLANLPPGARLRIGGAVVEVTAPEHNGCAKFAQRFGPAALRFVNEPDGKLWRLRGLNARVVEAGAVAVGDAVQRL